MADAAIAAEVLAAQVLAAQVLAACNAKGLKLATAESLTGGLLAATLVSVPGASQVFLGGVVAYANAAKQTLAGVNAQTLTKHGAVSPQTAIELAEGARAKLGSAGVIGVSTTGVAGPDTQDNQPVGKVFIAVAGASGTRVEEFDFAGERNQIRQQAVAAALALIAEEIGA